MTPPTALWVLVSFGFRLYLAKFADYNATFGVTAPGVIHTQSCSASGCEGVHETNRR